MKKVWWGRLRSQFGNYANLKINVFPYLVCFFRSSSAYAKIQEYLGRIPPKIQKFAQFSLVLLSPRTQSRPGAERIRQGEGRLSRPPKTALERSYLTENSGSDNRILRPRRKKTPDRIPPKRMIIYIYLCGIISRVYPKYHTSGTNHTPTAVNRHQFICKTGWRISYQGFY